jgi:putative cell wall-binding protein
LAPERVETMEDLAPFLPDVGCWTLSALLAKTFGVARLSAEATAVNKKTSKRSKSRWSARVTKRSDALDLEAAVFKKTNPRKIALSLKRSAERSKRRKGTSYQSAMSMLNFYINRAGKNLPQKQKRVLEQAKEELRHVFGRA